MEPLLLPYIFNIIVLLPVGLLTLFGGIRARRGLCQGKFSESDGWGTILGALWTAMLLGAVAGLVWPVSMSPILMLQVAYKSIWLFVYVAPRLLAGRGPEIPWGLTAVSVLCVVAYPWVIPWASVFSASH